MKVVLDANVYVSTLISQHGNPHYIFDSWLRGEFEVLITQSILDEVGRVLRYPRIVKRHQLEEAEISQFIDLLTQRGIPIESFENLDVVAKDKSDNRYLECAVTGKADYLVTGDEHLLEMQSFRGIHVLNPSEFATLIRMWNRGSNEPPTQ
jgi:putative PIN family toxin of toxin-antitoxin system